MNTKGNANRQVRKTRACIKKAFLELVKTKKYTRITVKELVDKANINRSTFYYHYNDIYDLINNVENELVVKVSDALKKISREQYIPGCHPQHIGVFNVILQDVELYRILTGKNGDIEFLHKFSETLCRNFYAHWSKSCAACIPKNLDMYTSYVIHGILGVFVNNLKNNCSSSAQEMGYFTGEVTNWIDEMFVKSSPDLQKPKLK